jgi:hypothetical protein
MSPRSIQKVAAAAAYGSSSATIDLAGSNGVDCAVQSLQVSLDTNVKTEVGTETTPNTTSSNGDEGVTEEISWLEQFLESPNRVNNYAYDQQILCCAMQSSDLSPLSNWVDESYGEDYQEDLCRLWSFT